MNRRRKTNYGDSGGSDRKRKAEKYKFPTLLQKEICDKMNTIREMQRQPSVDIKQQKEQLKKPTPQLVNVWYTLLGEQCGLNFNQTFECEESYMHSMAKVHFTRKIIKLISQTCGMNDFGWQDLVKPDPQRTVKALSALINFARFKEQLDSMLQPHVDQEESILTEIKEAKLRAEQAMAKLADAEKQAAQKREETDKFKAMEDELKSSGQELQKELGQVETRLTELRVTVDEKKAGDNSLQVQLTTNQNEIQKLQSQIVRSPERRKRTLQKMKKSSEKNHQGLLSMKKQVQKREEETRRLKDYIDLLGTFKEKFAKIQTVREKCREIEQKIEHVQNESDNLASHNTDLQQATERGKRRIAGRHSQIETLKVQIKKKEAEWEDMMKRKTEDDRDAHDRRKNDEKETESNNTLIARTNARMQDEQTRHDDYVERLNKTTAEFYTKLREYHAELEAHMNAYPYADWQNPQRSG